MRLRRRLSEAPLSNCSDDKSSEGVRGDSIKEELASPPRTARVSGMLL